MLKIYDLFSGKYKWYQAIPLALVTIGCAGLIFLVLFGPFLWVVSKTG